MYNYHIFIHPLSCLTGIWVAPRVLLLGFLLEHSSTCLLLCKCKVPLEQRHIRGKTTANFPQWLQDCTLARRPRRPVLAFRQPCLLLLSVHSSKVVCHWVLVYTHLMTMDAGCLLTHSPSRCLCGCYVFLILSGGHTRKRFSQSMMIIQMFL